jgi:hypothetical protein
MKNCTFKPNLDKASLKIAQKRYGPNEKERSTSKEPYQVLMSYHETNVKKHNDLKQ